MSYQDEQLQQRILINNELEEQDKFFKEIADESKKETKETAKYIETTFDKVAKNMYQSFDDYFFSAMKNGFGDLKDFGKSMLSAITDPIYRDISSSFSSMLLPSSGTKLDTTKLVAEGFTQLTNGSYERELDGGKITVDSSGNVTGGSNLLGGLSNYTSLLSAPNYFSQIGSFLQNPLGTITGLGTNISNSISTGFFNVGNAIGGGLGGSVSAFGHGFANPLSYYAGTGTSTATMAGGLASSALLGYGMGSIGDMIFGADTKAASYGAIGAAIGSVVPVIGTVVGGLIGSVIGGLFGSTKATGSGYYFGNDMALSNMDIDNVQTYIDYKKKSWFSSKSWSDYSELTKAQEQAVKSMFTSYNMLFRYLDMNKEVFIEAGKYSGSSWVDELAKNFLTGFMEIRDYDTLNEIYDVWVDYAEQIDKTVGEAIQESVTSMIEQMKEFEVFMFNAKGETANALKTQINSSILGESNLQYALGVSGITVDNYLDKYMEAMTTELLPEQITQWNALGDVLMEKANLIQQLEQQITSEVDALQQLEASFKTFFASIDFQINQLKGLDMSIKSTDIIDAINALSGLEDEELLSSATNVQNLITQYYNEQLALLSAQETILNTTATIINDLQKALDDISSYVKELRVGNLNPSLEQRLNYADAYLQSSYINYNTAVTNGGDVGGAFGDVKTYSRAYLEALSEGNLDPDEHQFLFDKTISEIGSLKGVTETTLDDVNSTLIDNQTSYDEAITALKDETIGMLEQVKTSVEAQMPDFYKLFSVLYWQNVQFLGVDSPIMSRLAGLIDVTVAMSSDIQTAVNNSAVQIAESKIEAATILANAQIEAAKAQTVINNYTIDYNGTAGDWGGGDNDAGFGDYGQEAAMAGDFGEATASMGYGDWGGWGGEESDGYGWALGGYTGDGSKYDVAGLVHKGELVWSQDDIKRVGGLGVAEMLRGGALPTVPQPVVINNTDNETKEEIKKQNELLAEIRKLLIKQDKRDTRNMVDGILVRSAS